MEQNIEINKKEEQPKSPRFDRSDLLSILAVVGIWTATAKNPLLDVNK